MSRYDSLEASVVYAYVGVILSVILIVAVSGIAFSHQLLDLIEDLLY